LRLLVRFPYTTLFRSRLHDGLRRVVAKLRRSRFAPSPVRVLARPIRTLCESIADEVLERTLFLAEVVHGLLGVVSHGEQDRHAPDRKSTRLNSSHQII